MTPAYEQVRPAAGAAASQLQLFRARAATCSCGARTPAECAHERERELLGRSGRAGRRPTDCLDHPQDRGLPEGL